MKKITIFLVLLIVFIVGYSQNPVTWFYVGAKGGAGVSMLYNSPSFDDQNIAYDYLSPSYYYGGSLGFLFGDNVGVTFEASMNSLLQKYDVSTTSASYHSEMQISTFDYGVLLSLQTLTGIYFNVGPKFSNTKSATLNTTNNRLSKFAPTFNALMVEIGYMPVRTDRFVMNVGIRGTYGFSSIVTTPGYIIAADDNSVYYPLYIDEATSPIQVMLSVELKYYFGRFGRASCGKYRFMFD